MKIKFFPIAAVIAALSMFLLAPTYGQLTRADGPLSATAVGGISWQTIVNNGFVVPDGKPTFKKYDAPTINVNGIVAFRATTGEDLADIGIFYREFPKGPVYRFADTTTQVPYPNDIYGQFTAFPAVPRIAPNSDRIVASAFHTSVWSDPNAPVDAGLGTAGIYSLLNGQELMTGMTQLGGMPYLDQYRVPNTKATPFSAFPGTPAITDSGKLVFNGEYSEDSLLRSGIYFRQLYTQNGYGEAMTMLIADQRTLMPTNDPDAKIYEFGTFNSPTVYGDRVVFTGFDDPITRNAGGIFIANIEADPVIEKLVAIGDSFADLKIERIEQIGNDVSFDGQYVAFWASWGDVTRNIRLNCPTEGDPTLIAYCNGVDPASLYDKEKAVWYQTKDVPAYQGIFLYNIKEGTLYLAAKTGRRVSDFVFWNYSGDVNGADTPRWRPSVSLTTSNGDVVYKARFGKVDVDGRYYNPVDGLYMRDPVANTPVLMLVETGMEGSYIDPTTPMGATYSLPITNVDIDRDGFRGDKLAVLANMSDGNVLWGGIYYTDFNVIPTKAAVNTMTKTR